MERDGRLPCWGIHLQLDAVHGPEQPRHCQPDRYRGEHNDLLCHRPSGRAPALYEHRLPDDHRGCPGGPGHQCEHRRLQ